MVKPEKFDRLHLVYHFTVPLTERQHSFFMIQRPDFVLKACVRYFLSNFYFSPNDSPLKIMKNIFYFI